MLGEVHSLDGRLGRETGPLEYDELEAIAEPASLRAPRRPAAGHAPVHEDDPLHPTILEV